MRLSSGRRLMRAVGANPHRVSAMNPSCIPAIQETPLCDGQWGASVTRDNFVLVRLDDRPGGVWKFQQDGDETDEGWATAPTCPEGSQQPTCQLGLGRPGGLQIRTS